MPAIAAEASQGTSRVGVRLAQTDAIAARLADAQELSLEVIEHDRPEGDPGERQPPVEADPLLHQAVDLPAEHRREGFDDRSQHAGRNPQYSDAGQQRHGRLPLWCPDAVA